MATIRIIPMHVHSGHTIAQSLNLRTNYAINPEKTNDGEYVSAYECNPSIADKEFLYNRRCYEQNTGRNPRFSADLSLRMPRKNTGKTVAKRRQILSPLYFLECECNRRTAKPPSLKAIIAHYQTKIYAF